MKYQFTGVDSYDGAGTSDASAGDMDGDGKDDLIIGAPKAGSLFIGAAYLMTAAELAVADTADGPP